MTLNTVIETEFIGYIKMIYHGNVMLVNIAIKLEKGEASLIWS